MADDKKETKAEAEIAAASGEIADARAAMTDAYDRDFRAKRDAALDESNTKAQLEAQARLAEEAAKAAKADAKK